MRQKNIKIVAECPTPSSRGLHITCAILRSRLCWLDYTLFKGRVRAILCSTASLAASSGPMITIPVDRLACTAVSSIDRCPNLRSHAGPLPDPMLSRHQLRSRQLVCAAQPAAEPVGDRFDVGAAVISPAYRSTPWQAEAAEEESGRTHVRSSAGSWLALFMAPGLMALQDTRERCLKAARKQLEIKQQHVLPCDQ